MGKKITYKHNFMSCFKYAYIYLKQGDSESEIVLKLQKYLSNGGIQALWHLGGVDILD